MDSFYTLNVDKNRIFLTLSSPHLVHVVIEWPLTDELEQMASTSKVITMTVLDFSRIFDSFLENCVALSETYLICKFVDMTRDLEKID